MSWTIHSSQVHTEHSPGLATCLSHKTSIGKLKKTEIISSIFSDHNAMQLEINNKKKNSKKHKYVVAKQYATQQPLDH